jgi:hypothetical protein
MLGESLAAACRAEHIKPQTFLRHVGRVVRHEKSGGRYRVARTDTLRRDLEVQTPNGPVHVAATLPCIDVADGTEYELSLVHDTRRSKVIPQTYGYVLHLYPFREESKSLAPDGSPCVARTRGVLQRASVIAEQQHFVGKETDRRWEFGDDLSVLRSKSMEYRPRTTVADTKLREQVAAAGVRALMRTTNLSQHTLEAIRMGRRVRGATLQRVIAALAT